MVVGFLDACCLARIANGQTTSTAKVFEISQDGDLLFS
jgi:hypothetical protein